VCLDTRDCSARCSPMAGGAATRLAGRATYRGDGVFAAALVEVADAPSVDSCPGGRHDMGCDQYPAKEVHSDCRVGAERPCWRNHLEVAAGPLASWPRYGGYRGPAHPHTRRLGAEGWWDSAVAM
jgi:hypothetical protein